MSRRTETGVFLRNPEALDSFGSAPDNVTAAYIVWTLTSSGETNLTTEITYLKGLADQQLQRNQVDAYFFGLLAASLFNLNRAEEAYVYADAIIDNQLPSGNVTQSLTSVTNSMGQNLVVETTGVAVIAWLFDQDRYGDYITPAVNWLVSSVKQGGSYGSTQGTILSLKAITSYMQNFASLNGNGTFVLTLNNTVAQAIKFTSAQKASIQFDFTALAAPGSAFANFFVPGSTFTVGIALVDFTPNVNETKDFRVNYAFNYNYYDVTPLATSSVLNFAVKQAFVNTTLGSAST